MNIEKNKEVAREIARNFCTLSLEALTMLAEIIIPMKFKRGSIVLNEGEVCDHIYYVEKGLVRQYYKKNNKEMTEHISYEGGLVVCIESFFQRTPTKIVIQALESTVLYAIPIDKLRKLTEGSYEICLLMFRFFEWLLIVSQQKADTLRFETAKERYVRTLRDHPDIIRRSPLHYVASYLQMTPETLSRVRAAYEASKE